jgi:hypothetical protein
MPAQFGVRGSKLVQGLAGSGGFNLNFGMPAGELPQRRRNGNGYWHCWIPLNVSEARA